MKQALHEPMVASDNDRARAGFFALLDLVDLAKTLAFVCCLELLRELVVADATRVYDRVGRKNVLNTKIKNSLGNIFENATTYGSTASGILRGSTCNVGDLVLFDQLSIAASIRSDGHLDARKKNAHRIVLFFRENSIVCLQIVLCQQRLPLGDLHVKQGVSDAEKFIRHGG